MATTSGKKISTILLILVTLALLWASAAFLSDLYHLNWQVGTLLHQYMAATGMLKPMHTLVDFYTHIKGIEYLICVAFFVVFPVFVKYINKEKRPAKVTA